MKKTLALILACLLITGCGPVPERFDDLPGGSSSLSSQNSVPDESTSSDTSMSGNAGNSDSTGTSGDQPSGSDGVSSSDISSSDSQSSPSSSTTTSSSKPQSSSSSSTTTSSSKPQSSSPSSTTTSSSKPQSSSSSSTTAFSSKPQSSSSSSTTTSSSKPQSSSSSSTTTSSSKPQSSSSSSTTTSSSKPQSSSSSSTTTSSSKPQSSSSSTTNTQNPPPDDVIGKYDQRSQTAWEIEYANEVFQLVNEERVKAGLPEFKKMASLTQAATVRAWECLVSYGHERPDGQKFSTALDEQGIRWRSCGENIAAGQKTPQQVVTAWMNSPGHRANILSEDFTYLGVGFYYDYNGTDGTYRYYWAQNFCMTL